MHWTSTRLPADLLILVLSRYGLTCSDYLAFTGERSGLCGQAAGRVFVLPVRGQQGVTLTTDTQAGQGEVGFNLAYK